jgi:RNA polymerase sigma-70 factor (ECF subfamily)
MRSQDEAAIVACIPSLRRYARGLTSHRDEADDLVQDTLERAWKQFSLWQKRSDIRAWMFGILHNRFIDLTRSRGRSVEQHTGDTLPEVPQRAMQADQLEIRDLQTALQRLPIEQREVLLLVGVEGLTYQEASAVLDVPLGTVMSRLSRGRESLRLALQGPDKQDVLPARMQLVKP